MTIALTWDNNQQLLAVFSKSLFWHVIVYCKFSFMYVTILWWMIGAIMYIFYNKQLCEIIPAS